MHVAGKDSSGAACSLIKANNFQSGCLATTVETGSLPRLLAPNAEVQVAGFRQNNAGIAQRIGAQIALAHRVACSSCQAPGRAGGMQPSYSRSLPSKCRGSFAYTISHCQAHAIDVHLRPCLAAPSLHPATHQSGAALHPPVAGGARSSSAQAR